MPNFLVPQRGTGREVCNLITSLGTLITSFGILRASIRQSYDLYRHLLDLCYASYASIDILRAYANPPKVS
jgi:hypothetical protein